MDFNFEFGFFSYLIDWFGLSRFGDASAQATPGESNATSAPIGG